MAGCLQQFRRNEKGGVLAELAVTIVPFLLMLGLVFEGGRILWTHQIAAKAARDATRYLSRVPDPNDAASQATAKNLALTGLLAGGQPAIRGWTVDDIDIQVAGGVVAVAAEVDLNLPFAGVFQIFAPSVPASITYQVGDQARWYGE
jgi:Flp pilus assembly protein TadG